MTIKIGSNIASIQAQRRLGEATSSLSKIYERLSSGQRINTASDDAAGLAIANDLSVKNRVFTQAIRNGNDGISALNIADSALENLTSVVTRIRELAEQSANGTYSNKQRAAIDKEAQSLKAEFFRISKTTTFNGVKLFDGSLGSGLRLQLGFGVEGSINTSVGGAIGTGAFAVSASFAAEGTNSQAVTLGDLNGDGVLDLVTAGNGAGSGYATVSLGTGGGSFGTASSFATEGISFSIALGDLNADGVLDLVTAGTGGATGYATVRLGTGNGSFGNATSYIADPEVSYALSLGDLNGDGILDLVTTGYTGNGGSTTIRLGVGNGSFAASMSYDAEAMFSKDVTLGDLNGDGFLDLVTTGFEGSTGMSTIRLGTGNGLFGAATTYAAEDGISEGVVLGDLNSDGILDLVTAGYGGSARVRLGTGSGTFGSSTSYATESYTSTAVTLGDLNGDGILDLLTSGYGGGGFVSVRLGSGTGSFGAKLSYSTESTHSFAIALGDINADGVLDFVSAGTSSAGQATAYIGSSQDGLAPLLNFTLKTKVGALQAMGPIKNVQDNLAKQRGVIGAYQSRVGIALNNLSSSKENFSAAESRIRDADVAAEAANLIRTQILQQAATSILAQANQAPALALTLLR